MAKLGQDYTVYAYDYSEQDTPLVGQGMLSWALASPSARAGTPRPRAIITGRVSKNALGLFSSGATETLEVKLRLVPVPTCQQNEFISSMDTYRELSKIIPADFDATAWTSFLQNNPGLSELTEDLKSSAHHHHQHHQHISQQTGVGMETLSQLMQQGMPQRHPSQQLNGPQSLAFSYPVQNEASPYDQVSRTVSPFTAGINTMGYPNGMQAPVNMQVVPSRPASQASMTENGATLMSESDPASSVSPEVGNLDLLVLSTEEPAKKRVCTTRAEWNGKSSLGNAAESLRVTASTAASVRTVRPLAAKPSISEAAPLEQPPVPRQPTPRPNAANPRPRRARPSKASSLRRDSARSLPASSDVSPPAVAPAMTEIVFSSCPVEDPRGGSAVASPAEMASSPPVLERPSPAPSSPALPMLPHMIDSGFGSGSGDGECETQDNTRFAMDEELDAVLPQDRPAQPVRVLPLLIQEVTPGPPELLPTTYQPRPMRLVPALTSAPVSRGRRREPNRTALNATGEKSEIVAPKPTRPILPNLQSTARSSLSEPIRPSSAAEMGMPAAGPTMGEPSGLLPSSTPINIIRSVGPAPAPSPSLSIDSSMSPPMIRDGIGPSTRQDSVGPAPAPPAATAATAAVTGEKPQIRSGSGAKRKRAIENRLNRAINLGEMPPYCENCGAIETPTWRKAWCKRISGPEVDRVQISQEDGGVIGIRDVQKDASDKITTMSILKRNLLVTDEGFVVIQLCNRRFSLTSLALLLFFSRLSSLPPSLLRGLSVRHLVLFLLTDIGVFSACGLWLHKFKCMRPEVKWNKGARDPVEKKKKKRAPRKDRQGELNRGQGRGEATLSNPQDVTSLPNRSGDRSVHEGLDENSVTTAATDESNVQSGPMVPPNEKNMPTANEDAIVSVLDSIPTSLVRGVGTPCHPIDVDDQFGSTRRTLFPSPEKGEGSGAVQDMRPHEQAEHGNDKEELAVLQRQESTTISNKENMTPMDTQGSEDDELSYLFEGEGGSDDDDDSSRGKKDRTPRTPPSQPKRRKSPPSSNRTTTSSGRARTLQERVNGTDLRSSLSSSSSSRGKPTSLIRTPNKRHQLRSSPSRSNHNQEGGGEGGGGMMTSGIQDISPFTAHIHQILSDAKFSPSGRLIEDPSNVAGGMAGGGILESGIMGGEDLDDLLPLSASRRHGHGPYHQRRRRHHHHHHHHDDDDDDGSPRDFKIFDLPLTYQDGGSLLTVEDEEDDDDDDDIVGGVDAAAPAAGMGNGVIDINYPAIMPSSPPSFFTFYEDPIHHRRHRHCHHHHHNTRHTPHHHHHHHHGDGAGHDAGHLAAGGDIWIDYEMPESPIKDFHGSFDPAVVNNVDGDDSEMMELVVGETE